MSEPTDSELAEWLHRIGGWGDIAADEIERHKRASSQHMTQALKNGADFHAAQAEIASLKADLGALRAENERLRRALVSAEAALSGIGDADREPGDDVAWCEMRAAASLPIVRAALEPKP